MLASRLKPEQRGELLVCLFEDDTGRVGASEGSCEAGTSLSSARADGCLGSYFLMIVLLLYFSIFVRGWHY